MNTDNLANKIIPFSRRKSLQPTASRGPKRPAGAAIKIGFEDYPYHASRILESNINGYNRFKEV